MSAFERLLRCTYALAAVGFADAFRHFTFVRVPVRVNCANHICKQYPSERQDIQTVFQRRDFIEQIMIGVGSLLVLSPRPSFAGSIREPSKPKISLHCHTTAIICTIEQTTQNASGRDQFSPPDARGYALGITVDPVRIKSIREFGTPEEVAARVVTAEVNRDGVFQVTLAKDPVEDADAGGCYDIEYMSEGKRGIKRFVTRIYIKDGFLYVLTAQSKEDEYDTSREKEVAACVKSFKPL
ncbi:hypothetical protein HJC23_009701 [Cyclotella cryptica]|uniref:PsbP C-terminal domain-containing protein n=1 Tax=Cyclotella cryptica TaxID=29204 RepID=A0ABD3Q8Q9_9STRA